MSSPSRADKEWMDLLTDDLLLHILNYVSDVKSLCRCSSVSRRFHHLVPLVSSLFIPLDYIIPRCPSYANTLPPFLSDMPTLNLPHFTVLSAFICFLIFELLDNDLLRPFERSLLPPPIPSFTHPTPVRILKSFSHLHTLCIDLPSPELSFAGSSTLFRWRAHFGSSLNRCLILAAAGIETLSARTDNESAVSNNDTIPDFLYKKIGRLCTIASVCAACSRHTLVQPILAGHPTVESLALTDADGQGVLCLNRDELRELRAKPMLTPPEKTNVPSMRMWEWYLPFVELPCGAVLKGAILIAVRPTSVKEMGLGWVEEEFDGSGIYAQAVRSLVKGGRTYCTVIDVEP